MIIRPIGTGRVSRHVKMQNFEPFFVPRAHPVPCLLKTGILVLFSGTGVGKRPVGVATPTGRLAAAEKLTDQTAFAQVARNANDANVRLTAVRKLTNQVVLLEVARKEKNGQIRIVAARKLTNQTALAEITRNDEEEEIRIAAVETLTDRNILTQIAKEQEERAVRRAAEMRLEALKQR